VSAAEHSEMSEEFLEEHIEHADERWLMSYADMMTLLFGLFVLLYAMYDHFEVVQQAAGGRFSSSQETSAGKESPAPDASDAIEKLKIENETLRVKAEALEMTLAAERAKAAETRVPDPSATVQSLEKEREVLSAQLAQARTEIQLLSNQMVRKEHKPAGGMRGGPKPDYSLTFALPDGTTIHKTMKGGVGPNGLQLDEALDVRPGQNFNVTITREGKSINVTVRSLKDDNGQTSPRLKFMNFPNGGEDVLQEWTGRRDP